MNTYTISLYYDRHYCGLSDRINTTGAALEEDIHELISKGGYMEVHNDKTGVTVCFSSDTYWNDIYIDGEISLPEELY